MTVNNEIKWKEDAGLQGIDESKPKLRLVRKEEIAIFEKGMDRR
ncbi:hypothetical protein ACFQ0W_04405 [Streptococcus saliviloxodontae]